MLAGGASILPYTAQFFSEKLNVPVEYFNPLRSIQIDPAVNPEELAKVPKAPGSLDEALNNLRRDQEFLLKGDVFTPDVIETWVAFKQEREIDQVQLRPHPWEFYLYYDI